MILCFNSGSFNKCSSICNQSGHSTTNMTKIAIIASLWNIKSYLFTRQLQKLFQLSLWQWVVMWYVFQQQGCILKYNSWASREIKIIHTFFCLNTDSSGTQFDCFDGIFNLKICNCIFAYLNNRVNSDDQAIGVEKSKIHGIDPITDIIITWNNRPSGEKEFTDRSYSDLVINIFSFLFF